MSVAQKQLVELYKIPTHTTSDAMKQYMMDAIPHYEWQTDEYGNLYGTYPGSKSRVVLSAHLDMVKTGKDIAYVVVLNDVLFGLDKKAELTSLGADDKNGLWCIIQASKHESHPNIVLFDDEEIGRKGSIACNKAWFKDKNCCIVIDRKGDKEIIIEGMRGQYSNVLGACFKSVNPDWKYATGAGCDADSIRDIIDCINISCGYYNAHTAEEFTRYSELQGALDAVLRFLDTDWSGVPWQAVKELQHHRYATSVANANGTGTQGYNNNLFNDNDYNYEV